MSFYVSLLERLPVVHGFIYTGRRCDSLAPEDVGLSPARIASVTTRTDDGLILNGWHVRAGVGASGIPVEWNLPDTGFRPVVLYFPGRGGHRGVRVLELDLLAAVGADVYLFDYRGYGDNPGRPAEEGLTHDARAVWRFAVEDCQIDPERLVLYGESLGGAVAVRLAAEQSVAGVPPAGLVLRSAFTSFSEAARMNSIVLRWLVPDGWYPSDELIGQVTCPILFLHGRNDSLVPFDMGERLFARAPAESARGIPPRFVPLPAADHNNLVVTSTPLMTSALHQFFSTLAQSPAGPKHQPGG